MENTTLLKANMTEKPKEYNYGLDIIRIIAMFFVVSLHSLAQSFNLSNIRGGLLLITGCIEYCSWVAVPLFLLLTGYLYYNKTPTWNYYKKIFIFLFEYFMCCLVVWAFKGLILKEQIKLGKGLLLILTRKFADYSWYIEMFVGLFLVAPFINLCYKNISNKNLKLLLMLFLFCIFSVTSTTTFLGWNYWLTAYPIMYYCFGLFIREYQPKIRKHWCVLLLILVSMFETYLSVYYYEYFTVDNATNVFSVAVAILIFLLFYDLKSKTGKKPIHSVFRNIANLSIFSFLLSSIFDKLAKIYIFSRITTYNNIVYVTYITIVIKFTATILLSIIVSLITKLLIKLFKLIYMAIKKNFNLNNQINTQ